MNNIYYILQLPEPALTNLLSFCVEKLTTLRYSLDKKKCVVKLPIGSAIPQLFNGFQSYTHKEIIPIMLSVEWAENQLI